jgi:hypothetical protein|tara:strand:- start:1849 stop:2106 length:258 start_codon:yes stop_codon:yes gene_type:complete
MRMFGKKARPVPQSYQPVLEAKEVIELFSRLTLHHQAALLRLISRNLVINIDGETHMGYDFDFDVDGAVVLARMAEDDLGERADT